MAALLDREPGAIAEGSPLPECWHWLYFKPLVRQSQIGEDGHPLRGGFLPPVTLPRRMWAGGRLRFHRPLVVGERATKRSRILSVTEKEGRSGKLVFVTVGHLVEGPAGPAVEDEQDIVYRDATRTGEPVAQGEPAQAEALWSETVLPNEVALFRYSALMFNGHRIHYDHAYVTQVEGYPGLVVHGPLTATLMLEAATRHEKRVALLYRYRGLAPLFSGELITLAGRTNGDGGTEVWAAGPAGRVAMRGTVEWTR
ncbi:MAG: MaoC family dehydratase N-terminal domain-containing protein [Gemmatimonadetes bacterium]|nr:MaoC family dehydratase N-terminal domain-containing protein [Gemmatimonadota bacterium]